VGEALRARRRRLDRLVIRRGRHPHAVRGLRARAEALGVPVAEEPEEAFRKLAPPGNHQGVLLEAGPLPTLGLDELVDASGPPRLLVALDGVEDPQNVGAIARAADAAGAGGLVMTARRAPPLGPAVARASAGAIESLPVARVSNLSQALDALKARGFWIFGADPEAPGDVYAVPDRAFEGDACLVLGAEGRGLRPGVARRVDHPLRLPMAGRTASLNVAAAAAVLLYEWVRRGRG
jgi:23S rRNA (guanosine2251-2'-O)-methyltransferase